MAEIKKYIQVSISKFISKVLRKYISTVVLTKVVETSKRASISQIFLENMVK